MPEQHHAVRAFIAATSAVLLLSGCSGPDGDASSASTPYKQALERLPADAPAFEFRDVAGAEERLGLEDEHDPGTYIEAIPESAWASSSLLSYLAVMSESAWDATDIVWEAQILTPPKSFTVRRLDHDVDLDAAVDDLEKAGYTATTETHGTLLSAELNDVSAKNPGMYVQLGMRVLVLPDENLIVSARDDEGMRAYTQMDESLADAGSFDRLEDDTAFDVEYVYAQADSQGCDQAAAQVGEGASPEQLKAAGEQYEGLGTPSSAALALGASDDEPAATAQLRFADDDAAEADVEPRRTLLTEGTSVVGGAPYAEYFAVDDISVDGAVETIEIDPMENPGRLQQMIGSRDAPFLACGSS